MKKTSKFVLCARDLVNELVDEMDEADSDFLRETSLIAEFRANLR